jgi:hypothetical protein
MGIIYELLCLQTNRRYIGSTKLSKEERLKRHERHYKSYLNSKHNYISAWDILENGNYVINELENVEDDNMLKEREQYYYEINECVNRNNPKMTLSVLRQSQKKHNNLYKERHPDKYKEHSNKRNILIECSCCGASISKRNMARHLKTHKDPSLL